MAETGPEVSWRHLRDLPTGGTVKSLTLILLTLVALAASIFIGGHFSTRPIPSAVPPIIELHTQANAGHARAQFELGEAYKLGIGVAKDEVEAVKWFRKAAEQGHAAAQFRLGLAYAFGKGVAEDDFEARKWFQVSAEQGTATQQFNLGYTYENGVGVTIDDPEAVKWYRKAAAQGLAQAQYELGGRYLNGIGVPKDEVEAVAWYRKAAEQGYAEAQHQLGVCYRLGYGVTKDEVEAYALINLASVTIAHSRGVREDLEKTLSREEIAVGQRRSREIQKEIEANF